MDKIHNTEVNTEVGCNTKPTNSLNSRSRDWILTINNPSDQDKETFDKLGSLKSPQVLHWIYQLEKGEEGTVHIQGCIRFKNAIILSTIKKIFPRAHLESAHSYPACIKYCSKEESRIEEPKEWGVRPEMGRRKDLEALAEMIDSGASIKDVAQSDPSKFIRYHRGLQAYKEVTKEHREGKPTVIYIYGETGCGKTSSIYKKHGKENVYMKSGSKWWDGYDGQEVILIDDFDGCWPFRDLLRLLDNYPYTGEIKGGTVKINSKYIYITADRKIEDLMGMCTPNELGQLIRRFDRYLNLKPKEYKVEMPKVEVVEEL